MEILKRTEETQRNQRGIRWEILNEHNSAKIRDSGNRQSKNPIYLPGGVGWGGRCDGGSREETYVCLLLIHAVYCRYQHNVENNYLPIKNRLKNNKIKSKKKSNLIGHLQALINTGQGI